VIDARRRNPSAKRITDGETRLDGALVRGPRRETGVAFRKANLPPWRDRIGNIRRPPGIAGEPPGQAWINHPIRRMGLSGSEKATPGEILSTADAPDHLELCDRRQDLLLRTIREDPDLTDPIEAAVNAPRIVLAAERGIAGERTITFG
jgi:hypothetical protein